MFTVALVGADGAGKTTTANHLLKTLPFPVKYVYMGTSIGSSNVTLPTSRLLLYLKEKAYRKSTQNSTATFNDFIAAKSARRSKFYVTLRLLNRLFEEWYRQFVTWAYQLRGFVVLFDRHYLYEFAAQRLEMEAGDYSANENNRLSEKIHIWLLNHLYPHPDLVIFLDAQPEVLFARKEEWTLDHLRNHQKAIGNCGRTAENFIRVDANRAFDEVLAGVSEQIQQFYAEQKNTE